MTPVVGRCCDLGQGLGVQKQEDSGNAVGQCFGIAGKKFAEPCQALLLGECAAGRGCWWVMCTDLLSRAFLAQAKKFRIFDRVVGPDASHSSTSCCRQVASGAVMGAVQPGEKLDRLGDVLFGVSHRRPSECLPGGTFFVVVVGDARWRIVRRGRAPPAR